MLSIGKHYGGSLNSLGSRGRLYGLNQLSRSLDMDPTSFRMMSGAHAIPPLEATFTANNSNPNGDGSSTLSWDVQYASSVSLNQGIGTVASTGSTTSPADNVTRTYTLTAVDGGGVTTTYSLTCSTQDVEVGANWNFVNGRWVRTPIYETRSVCV